MSEPSRTRHEKAIARLRAATKHAAAAAASSQVALQSHLDNNPDPPVIEHGRAAQTIEGVSDDSTA